MPLRDVRAEVIAAFEYELRRRGCPHPDVAAKALAHIAEGRGVTLNRPALADDPAADHTQTVQAGDTTTGAAAVRAQIHRPTEPAETPQLLTPPPWRTETAARAYDDRPAGWITDTGRTALEEHQTDHP